MKTQRLSLNRSSIPGTLTALAAFASLVAFSTSAYSETEPASSEAKEYTLFIGGNLEVPLDNAFHPVKSVSKRDLEIEVNKALKRVSIDDVQEYKVVREPKLASVSATIEISRSERFQAGAARAALEAISTSIAIQNDNIDKRNRALGESVRVATASNGGGDPNKKKGEMSNRDKAIYAAEAAFSKAAINNDLTNGNYISKLAVDAAVGDLCDAIDVELHVSSPKPLANAYVVLVTECRDPKKPEVLLRRISPKLIGSIGPKPVKVSLEQQGFPAGFMLEKERLFLYSSGSEIATNLSDGRLELTREQAFRYLLVQYIASNGKSTLPPTPIMGALPVAFHSKVDAAELNQTVDITINKNGEITAVNIEKDGPAKLSPTVEIALKNFRFFPALKDGLPTEGKMTTKLSDLFRKA